MDNVLSIEYVSIIKIQVTDFKNSDFQDHTGPETRFRGCFYVLGYVGILYHESVHIHYTPFHSWEGKMVGETSPSPLGCFLCLVTNKE
jgi:hypothetical protein